MVGKRQWNNEGARHRGRHVGDEAHHDEHPRDLETGRYSYYDPNKKSRPKPRIMQFQDAARTALEDARRGEIKRALLHGIDRQGLEKYRKSEEELKAMKNKKLRAFYEQQNERLNDWLEVDAVVMAIADDVLESMNPDPDHDGDQERCGGIQLGRRRLEPLGILVFSIIMVISFLQILQESFSRLLKHSEAEILSWAAIASLLATIVLKGAIGLGCRPIKSSQVQALVQDCKTDVIFNTLSLLFPLIGYRANVWWLDPVGAGLLSLFIIYDWGHTCFENVVRLSGEAADDHTLKKLIYLAYRFAPVVAGFKNVTAYHAGDGVWVEFDVLLDEKTPLNRSHDIAETLQYCAEGLGVVDRAFVTTDYAASGPLGHALDSEWNH
ncbi:Cation efflux protein [Fusarium oxysporum f. sp. vasinfectum]|nr:Cation efflux protein [Fusarium oxysporum f. sp. vasinfectum]KAK2932054.1 Cation efflux protein [Fusarium oxysporum f. sp. vasinfectum]